MAQAVNEAFDLLGDDGALLGDIYGAVQHRPSENQHGKQQIRKVLQSYPEFAPVARGVWSRVAANKAQRCAETAAA